MAVPSTEYVFHIHVDSPNIVNACILVQQVLEGETEISINSRVLDKAEQKVSTLQRDLCGILSTLRTYKHYNSCSGFPIYLYCVHKPILSVSARQGQIFHRFFKYWVMITKFHKFKIIWTPGSNLAFPNFLSPTSTLSEANRLQLQLKQIPHDISFYDQDGHKIHYTIKNEDEQNA